MIYDKTRSYKYNKDKMEQEFEEIAVLCREDGMPEENIEEIHDLILKDMNNDRRFFTHTQPYYTEFADGDEADEGRLSLLGKFLTQLSVTQEAICKWGRMGWIEDLDTDAITMWVKSQPEKTIELLTLIVSDGLKQTEVAELWGVSDAAISKRVAVIRENLRKVLPEELKKQRGI